MDDQPAPILTADYALRAVYVTAGAHTVQFAYRPGSFLLGAGVTGAAGVVLLALLLWAYRRSRPPASQFFLKKVRSPRPPGEGRGVRADR